MRRNKHLDDAYVQGRYAICDNTRQMIDGDCKRYKLRKQEVIVEHVPDGLTLTMSMSKSFFHGGEIIGR